MKYIEFDFWINLWVQYGTSLTILGFFLIVRKAFTKYIYRILLKLFRNSPTQFLTKLFIAFEKPLRWLFVLIGVYLAILNLPFQVMFEERIIQIYRTLFIVLLTIGFYNFSSESSVIFDNIEKKLRIEIDKLLIPILSKLLRFLIIAISLSVIAQEWNYDVNGFIAGLGLGGLALAFAAQDSIANFFGGIIIMTEKPFKIGDWIKTPTVEGTVEEITFRSTKIRAFRQAVVTVPNSTLANQAIMNWSKMGKRQISFSLGVKTGTSREKLANCIKQIEDLLKNHLEIHQETIFVKFDGFERSRLNIFLYFFTKTTNYGEFLKVKEDINLRILEILEKEGVAIAIPTRNLFVDKKGRLNKDLTP
ncbi:mechanosensitive ion channel family protein [Anaerobacillus isosaccharinicus]|uniref:Mechanosensitive ion channel family protein n=2 Tax=Anaerobacillus isosaccharinicus TaxID=1532552 RepID=A0A1S2LA54_9BACI|nr:mechanosensitive ion channel family protein [Anaerobacillus isosaccharinicus]MBA5588621.1 mechanosensitive ion channel family protein [Anaerobacillus isosaccharinicus]QOY37968.1 mechanosensitive ion channel family protein [Anaerobacillus isosaccharinicus]